jgi:hypothetical protein
MLVSTALISGSLKAACRSFARSAGDARFARVVGYSTGRRPNSSRSRARPRSNGLGFILIGINGVPEPDPFGDMTTVTFTPNIGIILAVAGCGAAFVDFYNTHRPHRTLNQAAPLRQLPGGITDLDQFRVQRRDRAGGVIHEYRLVA